MVSEEMKSDEMRLDPSRVRRALSLFGSSEGDFILCTTLEGLGVELGNMSASLGSVPDLNKATTEKMEKSKSDCSNSTLFLVHLVLDGWMS